MARPAAGLEPGQDLPPYRLIAFNSATASENKIHDDDIAREYGFRGGLVPGVTVYAYMMRPVVEAFGIEWLGRGSAQARFLQPVYHGEETTVLARVESATADETRLSLEVRNAAGETCATGWATLPEGACAAPPDPATYAEAEVPAVRPPASDMTLRPGATLGTAKFRFDAGEKAADYLATIADDLAMYADHGVAHPGFLLRYGNTALAGNVTLGPWIHVSSEVHNYSLVHDGDNIAVRARVKQLFERKGHKFVELDVLFVANGDRPVLQVDHTAIYEVRKGG